MPGLHPLHGLVSDVETSEVPLLAVLYGYVAGMDDILAFMNARLRP